MQSKTVLITGVNGFIGSNIIRGLHGKYFVVGIGTSPTYTHAALDVYRAMRLPHPDFPALFRETRPDVLIHCAGVSSVHASVADPRNDYENGPELVKYLNNVIDQTGHRTLFVFPSSAAVYGNPASLPISEQSSINPISPYGVHKAMSERILLESHLNDGLNYVILRIFSCYGAGLRKQLLWDVSNKILSGKLELFGTGRETRDFIHISDVQRLVAKLLDDGIKNTTINVGSGHQSRVDDIVNLLLKSMGSSVKPRYSGQNRHGDPKFWQADVSRLSSLGFRPSITLAEGVDDYVRWFTNERFSATPLHPCLFETARNASASSSDLSLS